VDGWVGILVLMALGAGLATAMVLASSLLGPRNPTPEKLAPYECGMPAVGDARERQSVKFYLVAMTFLLFDIEIAFLFPWAMALRALGWYGFWQMMVFLAILTVGFVYEWRKGLLDWGPLPRVVRPRRMTAAVAGTPGVDPLRGGRVA
jgi:NADH-quinone oxidoreductase subunit A